MLLTNCHSIRDVLLFPHLRPDDPAAPAPAGAANEEPDVTGS
jgi:hypothetical protein